MTNNKFLSFPHTKHQIFKNPFFPNYLKVNSKQRYKNQNPTYAFLSFPSIKHQIVKNPSPVITKSIASKNTPILAINTEKSRNTVCPLEDEVVEAHLLEEEMGFRGELGLEKCTTLVKFKGENTGWEWGRGKKGGLSEEVNILDFCHN